MSKNKVTKQIRIEELSSKNTTGPSSSDDDDLYRFLKGGLAAK